MHLENVAEDDMQISVEGNSIRDDAMEFVAEVGLGFNFFSSHIVWQVFLPRIDSLKILNVLLRESASVLEE